MNFAMTGSTKPSVYAGYSLLLLIGLICFISDAIEVEVSFSTNHLSESGDYLLFDGEAVNITCSYETSSINETSIQFYGVNIQIEETCIFVDESTLTFACRQFANDTYVEIGNGCVTFFIESFNVSTDPVEYSCYIESGDETLFDFLKLKPKAVIDNCTESRCKDHGECMLTNAGHPYCLCSTGYMGAYCQSETNLCSDALCLNNATCLVSEYGATCLCTDYFEGKYCEQDIDECPNPECWRADFCENQYGNYTCIDPIVSEPCLLPCMNGGVCDNSLGEDICVCVPQYTGRFCELEMDNCESSPCLNDAVCLSSINEFSCLCILGYTGTVCEKEINHCLSEPCLNDAACISKLDEFICHCSQGFTGTFCEKEIDECLSSPCLNDAVCIDHVAGYSCSCKEFETGKHCEKQSTVLLIVAIIPPCVVVALVVFGATICCVCKKWRFDLCCDQFSSRIDHENNATQNSNVHVCLNELHVPAGREICRDIDPSSRSNGDRRNDTEEKADFRVINTAEIEDVYLTLN